MTGYLLYIFYLENITPGTVPNTSDEKLGESLKGVLEHEGVVEREVWTSPHALENNASNGLVECAPLLGRK